MGIGRTIEDPRIELTAERPDEVFDAVLMLDVIEHVQNDLEFMRSIVETNLQSGGWILLSVPAQQWLYSEHDRMLKHFRRYSMSELRRVIRQSDLKPILSGGAFHSLLLLRTLQKAWELLAGPQEQRGIGSWQGGDHLTKGLARWFDMEGRFSAFTARRTHMALPGLSYWALCVKSGAP